MSDPEIEPELPRGIALAWGIAAHPQRGPKRELSLERIVDTAVELADDGGLAAVSMSSVASRLGFTPMSLYRYVSAKEDLLLLMNEQAMGVPTEQVREAADWREALRVWCHDQLEMYRRHPWMLDTTMSTAVTTPNNMAWLDAGLGALAQSGLTEHEKVAACLMMMAQVRWQAQIERGYRSQAEALGSDTEALDRRNASVLRMLVSEAEFPYLRRAVDAGVFHPDTEGDPFAFALHRSLDGIEKYAAERPAAPEPEPVDPPEIVGDKRVKEAIKARREAEKALRDARKREREALQHARERAARSPR